jgi:dTDP-4-amino-4,6-dideoxygalactose transaminase
MRVIGGEIEVNLEDKLFYTDSGRSSLRLFFRSVKSKKVLLPDFLCGVIIDILKSENITYSFYHINEDLTINKNSIDYNFDVFYFINYFGVIQNLQHIQNIIQNKIIIEDNVFFYNFKNRGFKHWFSFNSYRKITNLADGSLIKTNLDINKDLIENKNLFSKYKYNAKQIKYNYIFFNKKNEKEYLKLFERGEKLLDNQNYIGKISDKSIYLLSLYNENKIQDIRKKRFKKLLNEFEKYCVNKKPKEYSFFVMKLNNRDKIRKKLFDYKIFLPVHWPKILDNILYDRLLSIPLFENYSDEEFEYIINVMKRIIND